MYSHILQTCLETTAIPYTTQCRLPTKTIFECAKMCYWYYRIYLLEKSSKRLTYMWFGFVEACQEIVRRYAPFFVPCSEKSMLTCSTQQHCIFKYMNRFSYWYRVVLWVVIFSSLRKLIRDVVKQKPLTNPTLRDTLKYFACVSNWSQFTKARLNLNTLSSL